MKDDCGAHLIDECFVATGHLSDAALQDCLLSKDACIAFVPHLDGHLGESLLQLFHESPHSGQVVAIPAVSLLRQAYHETLHLLPAYGVFLLLTEHAEQLLPTIRSRCVELRLSPLGDDILRKALAERFPDASQDALQSAMLRSGGYLGQAIDLLREGSELLPQSKAFAEAYSAADPGAILRVLVPMERLKRDQLRPILLQWAELLSSAAASRSGLPAIAPESRKIANSRTDAQLLRAAEALRYAISLTDANVGAAHICGMLSVKLSE